MNNLNIFNSSADKNVLFLYYWICYKKCDRPEANLQNFYVIHTNLAPSLARAYDRAASPHHELFPWPPVVNSVHLPPALCSSVRLHAVGVCSIGDRWSRAAVCHLCPCWSSVICSDSDFVCGPAVSMISPTAVLQYLHWCSIERTSSEDCWSWLRAEPWHRNATEALDVAARKQRY